MKRIPEIPPQIIDSINDGTFAVFIGAGVSRIAGLPAWSELANNLIKKCYEEDLLTYVDKGIVLDKVADSKKLITIAYTLLSESGKRDEFFKILRSMLTLSPKNIKKEGNQIFDWVKNTTALVLTTNADLLLDEYYEQQRIYSAVSCMRDWSTDRGSLVHLHGVITDENSLVFTVGQYLERYRLGEFQAYLKRIFNTKTVLFIGYGLAEFELLDYIVQKASNTAGHFILSPYFSYEEAAIRAMDQYYRELGIQQISYCIDKGGYSDLASVLTAWMDKIMLVTELPSITLKRLREIGNQAPSVVVVSEALQLIKTSKIAEKELFDIILHSPYGTDWLLALKTSFCFDPAISNPGIVEIATDGPQKYRAPVWHGLRTFVGLFEQQPDDCLHEMAIHIINRTSMDTINSQHKLNNWVTASQIADIFFSVDPSCLSDTSWEYLRLVINSRIIGNPDIFIMSFIRRIDLVSVWPMEHVCKALSVFLEATCECAKNEYSYCLDELTKKCADILTPLAYMQISKICVENITNAYRNNEFIFTDVGAFAKYPDNNGQTDLANLSYSAVLVIWLRQCIDKMNPDEAVQFVSLHMDSGIPLLRRAAIYCASKHFINCTSLIFSTEDNPFNDNEVYSDIYDMLIANSDKIERWHLDQIVKWIEDADFQTDNLLAQGFRRALIYLQLSKVNVAYHEKWDAYCKATGRIYTESEGYNVSKHIYASGAEWVQPDPSIAEKMEGMSAAAIVDYLNDIKYTWDIDEWSVGQSIESFIPKHKAELIEHMNVFMNLKEGLLPYFIRSVDKVDSLNASEVDSIWRFLDAILRKRFNKNAETIYCEALRIVRDIIIKDKYTGYYNFVVRTLIEWISVNEPNAYDKNDYSILLLNDAYAIAISLLVDTAAHAKGSTVTELEAETLTFVAKQLCNEENWVLRMAICYRMQNLQYLSSEWTTEHLPIIFNNANSIAVSYGYIMGRCWTPELYIYLSKQNYFDTLLSTKNRELQYLDEMKRSIAAIAVRALIGGQDTLFSGAGALHSVISNLTSSMLSAAIDVFKHDLLAENVEAAQMNHVADLLTGFLQAVTIHGNVKLPNSHCINIILECVATLNSIPDGIWEPLKKLIENAENLWVSDKICNPLSAIVRDYPLRTAEMLGVLLMQNAHVYMNDELKVTLSNILTTIAEERHAEVALELKNTLINMGYTGFVDLSIK